MVKYIIKLAVFYLNYRSNDMSKHLEKAKFLREQSEKHYNCAQTVLMSFSDETGLSDEQAEKVAADFGGADTWTKYSEKRFW